MALLNIEQVDDHTVYPEDVQRLISATEVIEVRLDEVHAGPVSRLSDSLVVDVEVDEPQVGRTDAEDGVLVRFTHRLSCYAEETPEQTTNLQLSHVVALQVREQLNTTWPAVAAWVETNIYFLAYPYVRQSVTALTSSLGMPPVVLGYLNRGHRPISGRDGADSQEGREEAGVSDEQLPGAILARKP